MNTLDIKIIPQDWQICGMCHCSAECPNCCTYCQKNNLNGTCHGQLCGRKHTAESQASRLNAWINIVSSTKEFKHLKKYLIKK